MSRRLLKQSYLVLAILILGLMATTPSLPRLCLVSAIGIAISACQLQIFNSIDCDYTNVCISMISILGALVIEISVAIHFINNWTYSSTVAAIAEKLNVTSIFLLRIISVVLCVFIIPGIIRIASCWITILWRSLQENPKQFLVLLFVIILQCVQLQVSACKDITMLTSVYWWMVIINTCAIFFVVSIVSCLLRNSILAVFITTISSTLWSLIDYFVIKYHGSPLFFSEFASAGTALNVLKGYSIEWSGQAWIITAICILQISLLLTTLKTARQKKVTSSDTLPHLVITVALLIGVVLLYRTPEIKPKNTMTGSWTYGVSQYGYISCIYEDIDKRIKPIQKPDGYDRAFVDKIDINTKKGSGDRTPDIIIILNESFYDLSVLTDIETDNEYLEEFYDIENGIYGYACSPGVAGGTNNTEFELLTSNSLALLPLNAPFTYLDLSHNVNSVASTLKDQGYSTVAMHCGSKSNYSRHLAYPKLGFDQVVLGEDSFTYSTYGRRPWTDRDNYSDMINTYESLGENPRFVYLLTMQNHGSWNQNDDSFDLVHVENDLGTEIQQELNEYLTSIKLSSQAFAELTTHFKNVERPVIICMLGDHAPHFIEELKTKSGLEGDELELAKRAVPFAIWANYDYNWKDTASVVSVTDLVPLIKRDAGLPLSTYDQLLLDLHETAPVRLPNGLYMDSQGVFHRYKIDDSIIDQSITRYLYAEYNLLGEGNDYRNELFES